MPVDVIYPVRAGDDNPELRFSLRTLTNLPHATVWLAGHQPAWVCGVKHIPGNTQLTSHANVFHNILAACRHPEVSDHIVIMNDDIFITKPVERVHPLHRGLLDEHLEQVRAGVQWWRDSLQTTKTCLENLGVSDPLSYELHTPFPADKHLMREILERFTHITPQNPPQWRTLYGNLADAGGSRYRDTKAATTPPGPIYTPYHSTTDATWPDYYPRFAALYPQPSPYEADAR